MADYSSEPTNQGTAWAALMARLAQDLAAAGQSADEQAVGEAYQLLQRKLTEYFQARPQLLKFRVDSVALADTVIDRLARQVLNGKPIPQLQRYAYGIAKFVYQEMTGRGHVQDQEVPETGTTETVLDELVKREDDARQDHCFQTCMQEFTLAESELLLRYFQADNTEPPKQVRKTLARESGLRPAQMRLQVHRLKQPLAKCLKDCLARSLSAKT